MWVCYLAVALCASFVAGFLTHRAALHAYLRPLVASVRGDLGGCSLREAFSALQAQELEQEQIRLRASSVLLSNTPDGLSQVKTERGIFWVPPGTDLSFVLAEQVRRIYGDGPYRVQPGDVVLDAGANVGAFTREALDAGAGLVVAIEPSPPAVESLRRTFAADIDAGRVRIVGRGVWNRPDTLPMYVYENTFLHSFVMMTRPDGLPHRRVDLPLTTIDAIVEELRLDRVNFLKMDIEGAERQALEGARQTIRRFGPRMAIATENLPDDFEVLPRLVQSLEPAYRAACGDVSFTGRFAVRPGTLFFYRQPE